MPGIGTDGVTGTSDSGLMRQVRAGRSAALATLFERHHVRLYRFFVSMTGNHQAAEDLVQDVFLRMLKYRKSFRDGHEFVPWMFRIARNACADYLRRGAAPPEHEPYDENHAETLAPAPDDGDDRVDLIRQALLALPAARREVLVLSRFELNSYDEVAGVLGCSVGAVKVRVHRAMKQLRQVYLQLAEEASP